MKEPYQSVCVDLYKRVFQGATLTLGNKIQSKHPLTKIQMLDILTIAKEFCLKPTEKCTVKNEKIQISLYNLVKTNTKKSCSENITQTNFCNKQQLITDESKSQLEATQTNSSNPKKSIIKYQEKKTQLSASSICKEEIIEVLLVCIFQFSQILHQRDEGLKNIKNQLMSTNIDVFETKMLTKEQIFNRNLESFQNNHQKQLQECQRLIQQLKCSQSTLQTSNKMDVQKYLKLRLKFKKQNSRLVDRLDSVKRSFKTQKKSNTQIKQKVAKLEEKLQLQKNQNYLLSLELNDINAFSEEKVKQITLMRNIIGSFENKLRQTNSQMKLMVSLLQQQKKTFAQIQRENYRIKYQNGLLSQGLNQTNLLFLQKQIQINTMRRNINSLQNNLRQMIQSNGKSIYHFKSSYSPLQSFKQFINQSQMQIETRSLLPYEYIVSQNQQKRVHRKIVHFNYFPKRSGPKSHQQRPQSKKSHLKMKEGTKSLPVASD